MNDYWLFVWTAFGGNHKLMKDNPIANEEAAVEVGAEWVRRFPDDIVMLVEQEAVFDFNNYPLPLIFDPDMPQIPLPKPQGVFVKYT